MKLAPSRLRERVITAQLLDWPRILPAKHRATPAGAGFGSSRFSSPTNSFRVLYAADNFPHRLRRSGRTVGQAFAQAAHDELADIDAILFDSRLTTGACVAIHDRAFSALSATVPIGLMQAALLPAGSPGWASRCATSGGMNRDAGLALSVS